MCSHKCTRTQEPRMCVSVACFCVIHLCRACACCVCMWYGLVGVCECARVQTHTIQIHNTYHAHTCAQAQKRMQTYPLLAILNCVHSLWLSQTENSKTIKKRNDVRLELLTHNIINKHNTQCFRERKVPHKSNR